ncbi:Eco57I restriction-modification methylase domain-containing protein [Desertifilum sp. FACHB-1129]|uniref:site-specific DNA-methyltransferase (adenine-specific) n=1 Tax=Desertifilum tharense IPPAS B-1220 TaxID=1781255 RepID=A0A1E5QFF6_9CYAN|nr:MULTISPECIES: DNA methyltransferase [Desertifilum]MDA0211623.1 Eco57I restriction-modification methylase domain-containing protein [Cyanobacteria bacterium FC1]MBD2310146.1 Eco57I restriction-modification methylase domain-containing protein [Desertifilum sp. FACHB-1129]MBD2322050.1 Eco57I restriction-modification methylase domain-containing protein [Desertifilum sp. FACHB-866]MBD2333871.1 Eco57I restriction-modification methylase domain-containing protein [Desertifilum sp. FACHB-868]OEJ7331
MQVHQTQAIGVCYTPEAIAQSIAIDTLDLLFASQTPQQIQQIAILDPACGEGVFLRCAYRYLHWWYTRHSPQPLSWQQCQAIVQTHLFGVDIDRVAIAKTQQFLQQEVWQSCQSSLPFNLDRNVKWGNAILEFDWHLEFPQVFDNGGFDAVIGNPPYADAKWMSHHVPQWREYCTQHYQAASGNWDLFCIFIELALRLCKPQGLTSFIVPNKLASARYAASTRRLLSQENCLLQVRDYSSIPVFPGAVYPVVYLAQKRSPTLQDAVRYEKMQLNSDRQIQTGDTHDLAYRRFTRSPKQPWQLSIPDATVVAIDRLQNQFPPLSAIADVLGAATVAEAYHIQALIREGNSDRLDLKLVNSGTIDRYQFLWGEKTLRYLGDNYRYPIIPQDALSELPPRRLEQAKCSKLVVAGMTKVLEAAIDLNGDVLAGKSTCIIFSSLDLRYLLALLNSQFMTFYYRTVFGGDRLQGGYLRVGVAQLRSLPIVIAQESQRDRLIHQVNRLLELYPQLSATQATPIRRQIQALNRQIDEQVYQLYNITADSLRAPR